MDFKELICEVRTFSERLRDLSGEVELSIEIAPPIEDARIAQYEKRWPKGIPNSLRELWTTGSEQINCPYAWTPLDGDQQRLERIFEGQDSIYGGVRFNSSESIFPGNSGYDQNDRDFEYTLGKEGLSLWCRSAVILDVGNGDCLGLDIKEDYDDPPVVYLVHDDDSSSVISKSFKKFLSDWAQLSFIGPEYWLLDYWIDQDGFIDIDKYKTSELAVLLTPSKPKYEA
ncbi:SMI1/KNR4 family protein [Roseibacillus persicicus]|nr:SMI1/KNR4 family protein [Roseibacillus persicicus]